MNNFLEAVKNRRSIYSISNEPILTEPALKELLEAAVNHTPSAFNSQTSRVLLLLGDHHKKLWDIVLEKLRPVTPPQNFGATQEKIAGFAAGCGTVLYYEEQNTIKGLQEGFPLYAENFPVWSQQSSGMLQHVVWTALELEGYGASLQHYNPLIDGEAAELLGTPESWKLVAQMPFGKALAPAGEKSFLPIETRVKVFGGAL